MLLCRFNTCIVSLCTRQVETGGSLPYGICVKEEREEGCIEIMRGEWEGEGDDVALEECE